MILKYEKVPDFLEFQQWEMKVGDVTISVQKMPEWREFTGSCRAANISQKPLGTNDLKEAQFEMARLACEALNRRYLEIGRTTDKLERWLDEKFCRACGGQGWRLVELSEDPTPGLANPPAIIRRCKKCGKYETDKDARESAVQTLKRARIIP